MNATDHTVSNHTKAPRGIETTTDEIGQQRNKEERQVLARISTERVRQRKAEGRADIGWSRPPLVVEPPVINNNVSIIYITFAHLKNTKPFDNMIFPSLDTFLKNEPYPYFVVLNENWKEQYSGLCTNHTTYCERIEPIWVNCSEGYYGASPCCKTDRGLAEIFRLHPDVDWYMYMDDDYYVRSDYLRNLLSTLDDDDPVMLGPEQIFPLGLSQHRRKYNCSFYKQDKIAAANLALNNRGAMKRMHRGFELGAIQKQCQEFSVTHDGGNAIMHWMYSLPTLRQPTAQKSVDRYLEGQTKFVGPQINIGMHKIAFYSSHKQIEKLYQAYNSTQLHSFQYV